MKRSDQQPPVIPSVQTIVAQTGNLIDSISVSGTLGPPPNKETVIVPQITGTLDQLSAILGKHVIEGEVIARIAPQLPGTSLLQAKATLMQDEVAEQQSEANALQQTEQTKSTILQAEADVRNAQAILAGDQAVEVGDLAAVKNAGQNLARQQTLFGDGLVAQKDIDDAQLSLDTANSQLVAQKQSIEAQKATVAAQIQSLDAAKSSVIEDLVKDKDIVVAKQQIQSAEAGLAASKIQAAFYTITAPISGTVTAIGANVGETVDITTKLVTISDLSTLQLSAAVPSNLIAKVHLGERVELNSDTLPSGLEVVAHIASIAPNFDVATGTVPVIALFDNSQGFLRDNLPVTAKIIIAEHSHVVKAPQSAILSDPNTGTPSIAIVGSDNILHIKPVTLGIRSNGWVEIKAGVIAGDRIVVSGQYGLTDGTAVSATSAPEVPTDGNGP